MKLHSFLYKFIIFSVILLFFIVPPFFSPDISISQSFINWNFPIQQLLLFLFSIFLLFILKYDFSVNIYKIIPIFLCLCLLFFTSLVFKAISIILASKNIASSPNIVLPESFFEWLFCFLGFFMSAFYEEVIYRFYFPDALLSLLSIKKERKIFIFVSELCSILVFAFAHFYLGWLSVANAAVAHIILRFTYKRTKSIYPGAFAHFVYNIISLILL